MSLCSISWTSDKYNFSLKYMHETLAYCICKFVWHGAFILLCQWVFHLVDNWSSVHLMPQCCTSRSWVSGFPYCCRLKELCFEVTPLCSVDLRTSSILCDTSALRLAFESSLNWLLFYPWSDICFKGKLSIQKFKFEFTSTLAISYWVFWFIGKW